MKPVFLGLGSNVGDRLRFLQRAAGAIGELPMTNVIRGSAVYETEPVGRKEQPDFLNAVLEIESELSPEELFRLLKEIERELGRVSTGRWGPREIDIDILYAGDHVVNDVRLQIPHNEIAKRRFVLAPLAELAPEFRDPRNGLTVQGLLRSCPDTSAVRPTEWKDVTSGALRAGR